MTKKWEFRLILGVFLTFFNKKNEILTKNNVYL